MKPQVQVIGVHPVRTAPEPCHLVEMAFRDYTCDWEWVDVTQEQKGRHKNNWQVAYDGRLLEQTEDASRVAFFFHYLDFAKPLLTPVGSAELPEPTDVPPHLAHIKYEEP